MESSDALHRKFYECCFTLAKEDILNLDKDDNGPINNVISGIERDCYGVRLFDDMAGITAEMFFVNNEDALRGDIIRLNVGDSDYCQLLLRFCVLLSNSYFHVDAINTFNTFQTKLRGFLEKLGFFTVSTLELKQFDGRNSVMLSLSERGIVTVDFIDSIQFYRDFFPIIIKSIRK